MSSSSAQEPSQSQSPWTPYWEKGNETPAQEASVNAQVPEAGDSFVQGARDYWQQMNESDIQEFATEDFFYCCGRPLTRATMVVEGLKTVNLVKGLS